MNNYTDAISKNSSGSKISYLNFSSSKIK